MTDIAVEPGGPPNIGPTTGGAGPMVYSPEPTDITTIPSQTRLIHIQAGRIATETFAAAEGSGGYSIASQAGEALGEIQWAGGIQQAKAWVGSLDYFAQVAESWANSLRVFGIGSVLRRVTHAYVLGFQDVVREQISLTNHMTPAGIPQWNTFFNWLLPRNPYIQSIQHGTAKGVDLTPIYNRLASVEQKLGYAESQIRDLYARLSGRQTPNTSLIVPLEARVHELETRVATQAKQITELENQIAAQGAELAAVKADVTRLSAHLRGVDVTISTWPEVQAVVFQALASINADLGREAAATAANTSALSRLAPLAILTAAGVKGINNLRRLQRNPCQCPKLPGFPNEAGTALAIYEFLSHG